ncbi:MAG: iron ABC transporter permease [Candidatus Thorarchaeota archaeon]|nr:MAG: iron ABC transporter permease [Candidatus Thorarchaeota archaeon]
MTADEKDEALPEEVLQQESDLVPVSLKESSVRGFMGAPRRIVSWFVNKGKSLGSLASRSVRGFVEFLRNPVPRTVAGLKRLRREMDSLTWIQLIGIIAVFSVFLILPLLSVVWTSFTIESTGALTLNHFINLFQDSNVWPWVFNPITGQIDVFLNLNPAAYDPVSNLLVVYGWDFGSIINSIYVAIIVTTFAVLIGVFLAFVVARYDFPGKSIIRTVLIFPILATPFVGAIGIKEFLGADGFLNTLFAPIREGINVLLSISGLPLIPAIWLRGLAAIIFVQSLSFFSLVYLNAYSSFMGIDPSLEEQAENLGAKGTRLFRSVTLPLAMPGVQAGAILTFILSIEDLGTPIVFQDHQSATKTLAFQVFTNVATQAGAIDPKGPAIGMLLLVISLIGFLAIRKYSSLRSYASGTKGGQWNPRTRRLSNKTALLLYAILIPLLFFALIPQISVIILSLAGIWSSGSLLPDSWTLSNYDVLWAFPDVTRSIQLTLLYGAIATVIIVLLGASAAYIIARRDIPGKTALDLLVTAPIALPGIVIATGFFTLFYNTPVFPLNHPAFLIIMSYTVRKFPFTVRAAYAGLMSTPVVLEEASQNVGASRNRTFFRITLPLIGVSVLAGSLLSYVYSVSEVSTSLLLGSVGHQEAPMTYWTYEVLNGTGIYGGPNHAACLGVLMMGLQMTVITVTNKILGTRSSAMTGI